MDLICVLFIKSPKRLSSKRDVFDFNASPNDVAPASSMLFSVNIMSVEKRVLLTDVIYVFLLFELHRLSFVSVVFDFNASLNDVTPVSPISSSVDLMKMEKS